MPKVMVSYSGFAEPEKALAVATRVAKQLPVKLDKTKNFKIKLDESLKRGEITQAGGVCVPFTVE